MASDPRSILTFVPAKDFDLSCRFYEALGFRAGDDDTDVRYYGRGGSGFLLQNFYVKQWANNFMMAMHVGDLDTWWEEAEAIIESGASRGRGPRRRSWKTGECGSCTSGTRRVSSGT